jgi:general secretion pathway protein J
VNGLPTRTALQAGFTLVEIMVAVVILAVISMLLWQSSSVTMNAKERYEIEDIRFHEIQSALARMSDDLSMAVHYQSKDHLGSHGGGEFLREVRFVGKSDGGRGELHFVSLSNVRYIVGSGQIDQTEISYYLKEGEGDDGEAQMNLMRRHQSPPDKSYNEGGREYVVVEDVNELQFKFYDMRKKDWRTNWDSSSIDFNKKMPLAVEIAIVIKDPLLDDELRTFKTATRLELAPGPNDF